MSKEDKESIEMILCILQDIFENLPSKILNDKNCNKHLNWKNIKRKMIKINNTATVMEEIATEGYKCRKNV